MVFHGKVALIKKKWRKWLHHVDQSGDRLYIKGGAERGQNCTRCPICQSVWSWNAFRHSPTHSPTIAVATVPAGCWRCLLVWVCMNIQTCECQRDSFLSRLPLHGCTCEWKQRRRWRCWWFLCSRRAKVLCQEHVDSMTATSTRAR